MVILNEKSVMGLFGQYCYPFIKATFKRRLAEEENCHQLDSAELFHGSPHICSGNGAACIMLSNRTVLSGIAIIKEMKSNLQRIVL